MSFYLVLAIFCSALGMFQLGLNRTAMNQPQYEIEQFLNQTFKERYGIQLTKNAMSTYFSLAVSIFMVGGIVGALLAGMVANKCGRRNGLLYIQVFSIFGAILQGCCKYLSSYEALLIGRVLTGISGGLSEGICKLYLVEIAPISIRGASGTVNVLGYTFGALIGNILGMSKILGHENTWPYLLALPLVPSMVQVVILPFAPESPRYLYLSKGRISEAKESLIRLRNTDEVTTDMMSLQMEEQTHCDDKEFTILDLLLSKNHRLSLFVGICLYISKPLTGLTALQSYSTEFFKSVGLSNQKSEYLTISMSSLSVMATIVVIPLMDRVGRRILHLTGLGGIALSLITITIGLNLNSPHNGTIVATSSALLMVFYVIGPGTIPGLATGEIFIQGPRGAANSICIFLSWAGAILVSLIFPQLMSYFYNYSFVPFTICDILLFILAMIYFPETKNKSSRELTVLFQMPNAWKTAIGFIRASIRRVTQPRSTLNSDHDYGSISRAIPP